MNVELIRASLADANILHQMQKEAFHELLETYQDYETNPGNEPEEKIAARLKQDFTYYYFICADGQRCGAVRIVDKKTEGTKKRISPIFILPDFQGRGIAQKAIRLCEDLHGSTGWALDTIMQEQKNCWLYEKMGYKKTGKTKVINDKMTLIFYEK